MAQYSKEYKLKIVKAYLSGKGGTEKLSKQYHVAHALLQRWIKAYQKFGADGLAISHEKKKYTYQYPYIHRQTVCTQKKQPPAERVVCVLWEDYPPFSINVPPVQSCAHRSWSIPSAHSKHAQERRKQLRRHC